MEAEGIRQVKLIDATPIGINVRSTVATYANVHDELRKVYARTADAKTLGYKAGDFSYNTGKLRCPVCDGTGIISLDVQFLPGCGNSLPGMPGKPLQPGSPSQLGAARRAYPCRSWMDMDVNTALEACDGLKLIRQRLQVLKELGLGLSDAG